mmetsp:Transcript_8253/g.11600  ORF Transcript_8253/g.11600 Transcript_8253/m.11600 type:complete len:369 (+) Transcript_8253:62-1168(+)
MFLKNFKWLLIASISLHRINKVKASVNDHRSLESCPDDGILDSTGLYCCPSSCGTCGGYDCRLQPGGYYSCCLGNVNESCDFGELPCVTSTSNPCPVGGRVDSSGIHCCPETCERCTYNCYYLPDDDECCFKNATESCDSGNFPCFATESNELSDKEKYCPSGILSDFYNHEYCPFRVCCPSSCPSCDVSQDCDLSPECCANNFALVSRSNDQDISCRSNNPPCLVPKVNDPCESNPCQNGAKCGVKYVMESEDCADSKVICDCEGTGKKLVGEFCDYECEDEEIVCGQIMIGYSSNDFTPNDVCCTSEQECVSYEGKYTIYNKCFFIERPVSCYPDNNCLNGGTCEIPGVCNCPDDYTGGYCEIYIG